MKAGISLLMSIILLFPILFISPLDTSASLSRNELEVGAGKEYATINGALTDAMEGDTILVHPGTYYEHLILEKGVRIKGFDDQTTIIDGSGVNSTIVVYADHVTIESLTLRNCGHTDSTMNSSGYDAAVHIAARYLNVIDCIFMNNSRVPVYFYTKGDYSMVKGCSFYGYSMNHIRFRTRSVQYVSILNNVFRNTGYGIVFYGPNSVDNLHIIGNTFIDEDPGSGLDTAISFSFWWAYNKIRHVVVANNLFKGTEIGVNLNAGVDVDIVYNTFENCTKEGVLILTSSDVRVHHNNFIGCYNGSVQGRNEDDPVEWSDGEGSGNYWSDYTSLHSGASGDGTIWYTPYRINGSAKALDPYPLVRMVIGSWNAAHGPLIIPSIHQPLVRQGAPFGVYLDIFDQDTSRYGLDPWKTSGPEWLDVGPGCLLWGAVPEDEALTTFQVGITITDGHHTIDVTLSLEVTMEAANVGHWSFTDDTSRRAVDSSDYVNDGVLKNNARWFPALGGSGVQFTGGEDAVVIPHSPSLNISNEYSILMCIYPTQTDQSLEILMEKGHMSDKTRWGIHLRTDSDNDIMLWRDDQNGALNYIRVKAKIPFDQWTHIAFTYDGVVVRLYINGELEYKTTKDLHLPQSDAPLVLSDDSKYAYADFLGVMDEVLIYNYPISSEEIGLLHEGLREEMEGYEYPLSPPEIVDSDEDGLPDSWEKEHFGNLDEQGTDDSDGDGYTNREEYDQASDPTDINDPDPMVDSDYDSLPDAWEYENFGNLEQWGNDDFDGDGYDNFDELMLGSDPTDDKDPTPDADIDGDSLPDIWEYENFGNLGQTSDDDLDRDGLTELEEYQMGWDPNDINDPYQDVDLDWDHLPDWWEYHHFGDLDQDASDDFDRDGSTEMDEYYDGTDPTDPQAPPTGPRSSNLILYILLVFLSIVLLLGAVAGFVLISRHLMRDKGTQQEDSSNQV